MPGRDADGVARTEADHFGNCSVRGALVSAEIRFFAGPRKGGFTSTPITVALGTSSCKISRFFGPNRVTMNATPVAYQPPRIKVR